MGKATVAILLRYQPSIVSLYGEPKLPTSKIDWHLGNHAINKVIKYTKDIKYM